MALSTLRVALRPGLFYQGSSLLAVRSPVLNTRCVPMASSALDQMQSFWDKNQKLGRPVSPWIIYKPHVPMLTSLCHRMTGIAMGVVLYGLAIGLYIAPGDFTCYVNMIRELELPQIIMFPAKTIVAFPLVYHYMNGIRHLSWDAGIGLKLATMYKTGYSIAISAVVISAFLASISYWA